MAHNTTVFRQLLDLLPRHEFDAEARRHQKGQRLRVMSRWAQFVALGLGQLAGLQSLRDIVGSLRAHNPISSITWVCGRSSAAPRWRG